MQDADKKPLYLQEHRILAAIVFTDAAGFSTPISNDEAHILALIHRDLRLMTEICQDFEGKVLNSTGDGLLMYFVSAVQAVACALEIQKALAASTENLKHRIGIHLGDIFFTDSDVMGNGVNVAAQLQAVAEPGGICLSQTVYDGVKNGLALQAAYLGTKEFNNIPEAVPVYQVLLTPTEGTSQSKVPDAGIRLTKKQYRDRQILLNKVRNYWIQGVLETSLHHRALIELRLQECLDAVMVWQPPNEAGQLLPPGTRVIDKFKELSAGRTLLILGEPGSGKTTTLLELARDLLIEAEHDITQLMPVIFNLSAWNNEKQSIANWLVQQLHTQYQVSQKIGQAWVKKQQLLLLLDGLDEVSVERREACVQALNQFSQEYGQTEIVVTSRLQDYQALSTHLQPQGAIWIQPLNLEQIRQYLLAAGEELEAVSLALKEDINLQELAKTPLILSMMMLAYQGKSLEELPLNYSIEEQRQHLFNAYIERMLKSQMSNKYSHQQAIRWLSWLAQRMVNNSQTVFLIEVLQPSWLANLRQKWSYAIVCGLIVGLVCGLGGGLNIGLVFGLPIGLISGLILGLGGLIMAGLILGFIIYQIDLSYQGIWQSVKNAIIFGLLGAVGLGLVAKIAGLPFLFGAIAGLLFGIFGVGEACIQHLALRLVLYCNGSIPWDYTRFLDWATERLFLQKVGRGYIFIHRLLLEHFARMSKV